MEQVEVRVQDQFLDQVHERVAGRADGGKRDGLSWKGWAETQPGGHYPVNGRRDITGNTPSIHLTHVCEFIDEGSADMGGWTPGWTAAVRRAIALRFVSF